MRAKTRDDLLFYGLMPIWIPVLLIELIVSKKTRHYILGIPEKETHYA
jgi:hypothetical protein